MRETETRQRGEGHRERLRQRFIEGGIERFTDEEVIEFLLTLGTPRKDVKLEAREALRRYGTLSGVLSAPLEELKGIKGLGDKNVLYLKLVHEVAGRYLRDRIIKTRFFNSSKAVYEYLSFQRDLKRGISRSFSKQKNELVSAQDVFQGGLTGSAVTQQRS
jgi:DNA repair protein RadC